MIIAGNGGNDTITGGSGNDTLLGGDGDDLLEAGSGDDLLEGGSGNHTILFGEGKDTVFGGDGDDTIDDVAFRSFTGSTVVYGGSGNDIAYLGRGEDLGYGGDGNDTLVGEGDNDLLRGDGGDDQLFGGDGDDELVGGTGNDTLAGGEGSDTFVFADASGNDRITDFDLTRVDGRTVDQFDVSDLTNANGDPVNWRDVTVTDTNGDGTGDAVLTFPNGETVIMEGVFADQVSGQQNVAAMGIPCFVTGTPILTPAGWRPVETLRPGDLMTTSEGPGLVIWAGQRTLSSADLTRWPDWKPIHFPAGAIGNKTAIRLSPQHAVQVQDALCNKVFVRAKHLAAVGFGGARVARGAKSVTYHQSFLNGMQSCVQLVRPPRVSIPERRRWRCSTGQLDLQWLLQSSQAYAQRLEATKERFRGAMVQGRILLCAEATSGNVHVPDLKCAEMCQCWCEIKLRWTRHLS